MAGLDSITAKAKRWLGYLSGDRHVEAAGAVDELAAQDAVAPDEQTVARAERMVRREHQELE